MKTLFQILIRLLFFGMTLKAFGLSPMLQYNDLVAGGGDAGYKDGPFVSALFNQPSGLALSPDGNRLYVADSSNHRIRVILLDEKNEVLTTAGNGVAALRDGPLGQASFNLPEFLSFVGPAELIVFDLGDHHFRRVDLGSKKVSTLDIEVRDGRDITASLKPGGMVARPLEQALYFTAGISKGILYRLDLKKGTCQPLDLEGLQKADLGPLCLYMDQVCVADRATGRVYLLEERNNGAPDRSFVAKEIGKGKGIEAMASMGTTLYAVPSERNSAWFQIAPAEGAGPLSIMEVWGDMVSDERIPVQSYFFVPDRRAPFLPNGFVSDPRDERRFFFSLTRKNLVLSLRDYRFDATKGNNPPTGDWFNREGISDFDYPTAKPPHTFRILITGDSHTYLMLEKPRWPWGWENRMETLAKRLELILNTMATLMDGQTHFQVLQLSHPDAGDSLTWCNGHVPEIMEKFDIDLCLKVVEPSQEDQLAYLLYPITPEGIPAGKLDPEYLIKPISERVASDPLVRDFYERCLKAGLGSSTNAKAFSNMKDLLRHKDIREDLVEMIGRPNDLLSRKVQALKTSGGVHPAFWLCFLPLGNFGSEASLSNEPFRDLWHAISVRKGIHLMDLSDPLNALKVSYYDTEQYNYSYHFNHKGQLLNALVLAHELIWEKLIPLEYTLNKK